MRGLASLRTPAILHWTPNHFVLLERVRKDAIVIVDPADGRRSVSLDEASRAFSGVAIELWPGANFRQQRRMSPGFSRYVDALGRYRRPLLYVLLANVCQQVLAALAPAGSQALIDHVLLPGRNDWLLPFLLVLAAVTVTQLVLQRLHAVSECILHGSLGNFLTQQFVAHLLRLPLLFLESRSHGDLLQRVNMQGELQTLLADTVQALFDLLLAALLIALMFLYCPPLGAVSLGLTALQIAVVRLARRPVAQQFAAELSARGRESAALAESAFAVEMTRGLNAESQFCERYAQRVRTRVRWTVATARLEAALGRAVSVLDAAMLAVVLWYGGTKVIGGEMTVGVFAGFLIIRQLAERPLGALVSLAESWLRVRGMFERCDDIFGASLAVCGAGNQNGGAREPRAGRIELEQVSFRFGQRPWLLRNVNITIAPGEHVAVIGPSGQGKSTLLKIICGLLSPTEGRVLLDGRDVREYGAQALAAYCGVVLQEPLILEGTAFETLSIRHPDCSLEEVSDAAELACFAEVVDRLSDGYDSRLAALGQNLSGGERQRLALAQALLRRPPLLLLDEGTCSLDQEVERRVMTNIGALDVTVVSIAHRASAVLHADRVLRLRNGHVEPVDHNALLHELQTLAAQPQREL